jgi:hypothetical protein
MAFLVILMIFMIKNDDDIRITKYYSAAYQALAHEFLEINDDCNEFG